MCFEGHPDMSTFTIRTAFILVLSTFSLLLLTLSLIGWATKPWDGQFTYASQPICAQTSYDPSEKRRTTALDPAFDYVPYYDLYANHDCSNYAVKLRKRPLSDFVQCGMSHYGPYQKMSECYYIIMIKCTYLVHMWSMCSNIPYLSHIANVVYVNSIELGIWTWSSQAIRSRIIQG